MQQEAPVVVRPFGIDDIESLLAMMLALAEFENYADQFRVTAEHLQSHGLGPHPPFQARVAHRRNDPNLLGMSVTYVIPWTYDLRPTLVLKELYVIPDFRHEGVGKALMSEVMSQAAAIDATRIQWTVLTDNAPAQRFYRSLGATHDAQWQPWLMQPSL